MRLLTPEQLPDLMQPRGRRPLLALAVGAVLLAVLTVLRLELDGILGTGLPFLFYILAVLGAAWVGGGVPGVITTVTSAPVAAYFFLGDRIGFTDIPTTDLARTATFVLVGVLLSGFAEALHRSRERVEAQARELQREMHVRRLREKERQQLQARKDQFLAILAHELRNPLAPIVNAAALLHARASTDPVVERAAQLIDRHAQHMVHLIDDLLDVARIERGTFALRRDRVAVRAIVEAAVEHCRSAIEAKRQRLDVRLPDQPAYIDADYLRLVQVVTNLLGNASSYTPEGGMVEVVVEVRDEELHLEVRDDGIGMAPDELERIFDMFERGARHASTAGLGIGLALVRQIVALHGGRVEASSAGEGRGSTFRVRLPGVTTASPPTPRHHDTPHPREAMRPIHVLVVDDNADLLDSLAAVLRLLGHQVTAAGNGEEALRLMAADPPDLVIMDVGMPGMSGYDVARRAALESWRERLTLVAMTGWGRDEDRQRALDAGFDVHVVKPLDLDQLRTLVESVRAPSPILPGDHSHG